MANILFIYENKIATVSTMENFYKHLSQYDSRVGIKFISIAHLTTANMGWCDILCMIRPNHSAFVNIAKKAREKEIIILFFLDDDLSIISSGNAGMPWRKRALLEAAKYSDVILSSSEYIAEKYGEKAGVARRVKIDTAVPQEEIKRHIEGRNKRIKLVYAAGIAHETMFDEFIRPIIRRLDDNYGDELSFTFMGVRPEIEEDLFNMEISYIDPMPLNDYRKKIESENFDIGIAPLKRNEFTRCKYFNKFIEYAMFGVVGVYSSVEPYTFVVENKINGILSNNTPKDWYSSLELLIKDSNLLSSCRENAYETLRDRFDDKTIMDGLLAEVPEMVEMHKKRSRISGVNAIRLVYSISRCRDWLFKVYYYLKIGGIKEVAKGITRHFRASKSLKP